VNQQSVSYTIDAMNPNKYIASEPKQNRVENDILILESLFKLEYNIELFGYFENITYDMYSYANNYKNHGVPTTYAQFVIYFRKLVYQIINKHQINIIDYKEFVLYLLESLTFALNHLNYEEYLDYIHTNSDHFLLSITKQHVSDNSIINKHVEKCYSTIEYIIDHLYTFIEDIRI